MKRSNLKKLSFDKLTIAQLSDANLREVQGGWGRTQALDCSGSCTNPTATICDDSTNYCTRFQPNGCY